MKKNLSILLSTILIFSSVGCSGVLAGTSTNENVEITQQVTGSEDMVSIRGVLEQLGYNINWEKTNKTLYASKKKRVIAITTNSDIAVLNDENIKMNKPATIVNGSLSATVASMETLTGEDINSDGTVITTDESTDDTWKDNKVSVNLNEVSGSTYTITKGGIYTLTGTYKGMICVDSSDKVKLILNGVNITNENGPAIYFKNSKKGIIESAKDSTNTLTDGSKYSVDAKGCVFSNDDLDIQGEGTITINANYNHGIASDDDIKIDDSTINITTTVGDAINANDGVNVKSGTVNIETMGDGINGEKYVEINAGTVNITTKGEIAEKTNKDEPPMGGFGGGRPQMPQGENGQQPPEMPKGENGQQPPEMPQGENGQQPPEMPQGENNKQQNTNDSKKTVNEATTETTTEDENSVSSKGIKSDNLITINGGSIDINSTDHSIKCDNLIVVNGGNISLKSDISKGIKAVGCLFINGGDIDIDTKDEGIESKSNVTINGGDINIKSQDDGINAGGGSGATMMNNVKDSDQHQIVINGGKIVVNAQGDGLDSNGNLYFFGGEILVNGPTSGGDGSLDSSAENTLYGGTLFAIGSDGMVECPKSEGQNIFNITLEETQKANSSIVIMDSNNKTIYEAVSDKEFKNIIFSSADIKTGNTYTVYINGEKAVTLTAESGVTKYGENNRSRGMGGRRENFERPNMTETTTTTDTTTK